jgi:phosphoglycerate dehydrogenase-like enzyme
MRVVLIGEAATHSDELPGHDIVTLPAEAAYDDRFDAELQDADVVVSLRFSREAAPEFPLLHVPGAGLDGIKMAGLAPGTTVCNVFEHEAPIAEYVLAAMLEWEIRFSSLRASFSAESWSDAYRHRTPHGEILGKTLGLVGYGRIGRAIADRAAAFGMRVVAVDDYASPDARVAPWPTSRLSELLDGADFVVVTCPLTDDTRGMLDEAAFARMKSTAVVINAARAPIIDEASLYEALRTGAIGGAVLDVWYSYPTGSDDRVAPSTFDFASLPNAWCTPHSSAWTHELPRRRYAVIADNIDRLESGQSLRNVVRDGATGHHLNQKTKKVS